MLVLARGKNSKEMGCLPPFLNGWYPDKCGKGPADERARPEEIELSHETPEPKRLCLKARASLLFEPETSWGRLMSTFFTL
jgi:hypothetical protein